MCELLALSANVPTDICFSFTGLMQRGGNVGPHSDGWGLGIYQDGRLRTLRDPTPCSESPLAGMICTRPIKSTLILCHIRQANVGGVNLPNTHPFARRLWGATWCFAHNGQLDRLESFTPSRRQPAGTTDSERAFCWLLDSLEDRFGPERPPALALNLALQDLCDHLRGLGVFNMLLADGDTVYTYCSTKLAWLTRRAPFGAARLKDADLAVDFAEQTTLQDLVTVFATEPLTEDEPWSHMAPGELCICRMGQVYRTAGDADTGL